MEDLLIYLTLVRFLDIINRNKINNKICLKDISIDFLNIFISSTAYNPYFTRRQLQLQPQPRQHQHQDVPAVIKGPNHLLL